MYRYIWIFIYVYIYVSRKAAEHQFVDTFMHIFSCLFLCMSIYVCLYIHIHVNIYAINQLSICVFINTCTCIDKFVCAWLCASVYIYTYIHTHPYMYTNTHTNTHTHTRPAGYEWKHYPLEKRKKTLLPTIKYEAAILVLCFSLSLSVFPALVQCFSVLFPLVHFLPLELSFFLFFPGNVSSYLWHLISLSNCWVTVWQLWHESSWLKVMSFMASHGSSCGPWIDL